MVIFIGFFDDALKIILFAGLSTQDNYFAASDTIVEPTVQELQINYHVRFFQFGFSVFACSVTIVRCRHLKNQAKTENKAK